MRMSRSGTLRWSIERRRIPAEEVPAAKDKSSLAMFSANFAASSRSFDLSFSCEEEDRQKCVFVFSFGVNLLDIFLSFLLLFFYFK
jgi:hypothetical protein